MSGGSKLLGPTMSIQYMFSAASPFWLVGFRPFFALGALAGMILPIVWALIFTGALPAPNPLFPPAVWHAHEMFYGFGWAVLGGFLLTSTKNWVSVRGYHGMALIILFMAWLLERIAMTAGGNWSFPLLGFACFAFLVAIVGMLMWTLVRYRQQDSYADNVFFLLLLPCFLVAKYLVLFGDFGVGISMTMALFRLAFLLMLERTLTQFMKGIFQVSILRNTWLDLAIKSLAMCLVFEAFLPLPLMLALSVFLVGLLLFRFFHWHPRLAFQRIDLGVMCVGYLMIVGQLLLETFTRISNWAWVGSVSIHLFTFGAMGTVIPAMIIRISKGHTGRKVVFDAIDRGVLYLMLLAVLVRVFLPQLGMPYVAVIHLSATLWSLTFGVLAWRYIPLLMQARVDGKVH